MLSEPRVRERGRGATRVERLVHTSTFNVAMGAPVHDGDESAPTVGEDDLLDLYSETKSIAEREVLAADAPGRLRTVALRRLPRLRPVEATRMSSRAQRTAPVRYDRGPEERT